MAGLHRKLAGALLVGLWIGLLTLLLNVRVEKLDSDRARLEWHPERSLYIAIGVAALGSAWTLLKAVRGRRGPAAGSPWLGRLWATPWRRRALAGAVLLPAALLPLTGNLYWVHAGMTTAIYVCLALGLNIVVGQAGLLVLGYAAFYAAGAYTYAILSRDLGVGFWLGIPAGIAVAALLGLLLGAPTLRLGGDYLAIVTLGFGEMLRIVLVTGDRWSGGPNGIYSIPRPRFGAAEASDPVLYWLILALVVASALTSSRLARSRLGRAWVAMREDETAARAMGVDIARMRLLAFSIAAAWAGLCGVFFAAKQNAIYPENFTFLESVTVLAMVVLGGMGSVPGVIAGAVILGLLPELLRGAYEYRMIAFAGLMILMMIFRPQGLLPDARRVHELGGARR